LWLIKSAGERMSANLASSEFRGGHPIICGETWTVAVVGNLNESPFPTTDTGVGLVVDWW